jgi:hypothetical protein
MMLFGEGDILALGRIFEEPHHAMMLVRPGGFVGLEEAWLAGEILGASNATNLIRLAPEDGKKGVGAAQIRSMVSSLSTGSRRGGERRLVVISDEHAFGEPAQNALLKMLEEPPEGVHFLLLAGGTDFFLPTIISRSSLVKLNGPNEERLIDYAKDSLSLSAADAKLLWMQAGREVGLFLKLSQDEAKKERSLKMLSDAKKFMGASSYERLVVLKSYAVARQEALDFIASLLVVLEIVASKGAKEALAVKDLVVKAERSLKNILANGNPKLELTGLVV